MNNWFPSGSYSNVPTSSGAPGRAENGDQDPTHWTDLLAAKTLTPKLTAKTAPEHRQENPIGKAHIPKHPFLGAFAVSFREGRWRQMFFCSDEAEWLDEWRFFTETFRKSQQQSIYHP